MPLSVEKVERAFGGVRALDGVTFTVGEGEVHGLIGPNGAGKTTLLNVVSGLLRPSGGTIRLGEHRIDGRPAHQIAAAGNVIVGEHLVRKAPLWRRMLLLPAARAEEKAALDAALLVLARVGLRERAFDTASALSYGEQRRVEIARALARSPRVLLLDEPTAGMNAAEVAAVEKLIREVAAEGRSVLLVEHNVRLVMEVSDRITVLNFGRLPGSRYVSDPPLLEVRDLEVAYGHVQAVRGISLSVRKGQIVTLIGPNGAGKSSTLNAIAGLLKPKRGAVLLEGRDLAGVPAHRAARDGIVLVPEGRAILQRMTVEENLRLAAEMLPARGERAQDKPASAPRVQDQIDEQLRNFPSLERRRALPAGQMSGGEQQMLAVARALLQKPRILLLDEPSMGLAPILVAQIFALLEQINGAGTTLLLVEQNARKALAVSDHAYVLERGTIAVSGPAADLARDPRVQAAYLGGDVAV
ncbi:MAG: ATP-binding cassette domain-containing protein [Deltaproteobacteria bacterium]|nr:MAG: ATP-binding cassette domain-containing protein [Deltaproteobacteria bacterium]